MPRQIRDRALDVLKLLPATLTCTVVISRHKEPSRCVSCPVKILDAEQGIVEVDMATLPTLRDGETFTVELAADATAE